jgi:hypothetical protein
MIFFFFLECKHLLSRMLVTNPLARAPLSEVLSHPWMCRGFNGPPDPHLLHREPLRVEELDPQVIRSMNGFEFGTEEEIERKLVTILESEAYQRAVQYWERKRDPTGGPLGRNGHHLSSGRWIDSLSHSSLPDGSLKPESPLSSPATKKSKRFSGFDFYRRKLFSSGSSPPGTPSSHTLASSTSVLSSSSDIPIDPTKGFHPLISIYFLAREKMERERVYGPGHFASSQLSLHDQPSSGAAPSYPTTSSTTLVSSAFALPTRTSTAKKPLQEQLQQPAAAAAAPVSPTKADYNMLLPRLPAPETSHFSGMSYDAQAATPSPTAPTFAPQPRPRDAGGSLAVPTDEPSGAAAAAAVVVVPLPTTGGSTTAPNTPTKAGLPRAPPASTHRRSHSLSQRPTALRGLGGIFGGGGGGRGCRRVGV